jgi:hypothetical protein
MLQVLVTTLAIMDECGNLGYHIMKKLILASTLTLQSYIPSTNDSTSIEKICEILRSRAGEIS